MNDPATLLRQGDLAALRALFAGRVRAEPSVARHRLDFADALILQGELERADAQLDLASGQDPKLAVPTSLTRQLIRAAVSRAETWEQCRPPELVAEADDGIAAALARLAGVEVGGETRELTGTLDGRAFAGLRDADDRTAQVLEVMTSTGKYVWVSLAQVASLCVQPPVRALDLLWRQAELEVRGGPTGTVYLPAVYPPLTGRPEPSDAQRLGRETDWLEDDGLGVGVGLRTFLAGDDAVALGEFGELKVDG